MTFVISILTGLGVGSGGLYILYLTLFKDVGQMEAQGLNLVFFITASFCAAVINLIKKRIPILPVTVLALFGIPGAILGSLLAHKISGNFLSALFSCLLIFAGVSGLIKKS